MSWTPNRKLVEENKLNGGQFAQNDRCRLEIESSLTLQRTKNFLTSPLNGLLDSGGEKKARKMSIERIRPKKAGSPNKEDDGLGRNNRIIDITGIYR